MEITQVLLGLGLLITMMGMASLIFGHGIERVIPLIALGAGISGGCLLYILHTTQNDPSSRYISVDEKRAAKMFTQNCKQVNYVQANNTTGLGLGVSTKGSPVVGAISSSNEDSYVYSCDGGVQYTLTYDIEKYRQFYK
ncbi:hypothetical protein [Acinetobacter nosocomialis]|uniref:hypothetical protein n=1 Tax=Acinetobacter nosocomialis TaxID=106654 RepID=UPI001F37CC59|nr:hypothetical protein [Acinetobacter nosocomialis]MCE7534195.1 hypothetical protein [Acinetobacter nosocomialis]